MTPKFKARASDATLRKLAEEEVLRKNSKSRPTIEDAQKLVHELQVHQTELEMQNDELRAAHFELAMSRDRYAELYDFAPVGYVTINSATGIVDANGAAIAMLGFNSASINTGRLNFSHFVARESQDDWFKFSRSIFASEEKQRCELTLRGGNGAAINVILESIAVRNVSGDLDRCMIALIDITERKKLEAELETYRRSLEDLAEQRTGELTVANEQLTVEIDERKRSEEHLAFQANLLKNISDAVYATDLQMRITSWNRASEKVFGWKEKDVLGKSIFDIIGPKVRPEIQTMLSCDLLENGPVSARIGHTTKAGATILFDSNFALLRDNTGTAIGFFVVNRDITDLKRAEEALRENERRLEAVFNGVSETLMLLDISGNILAANDLAVKRLGQGKLDFIGKNLFDLVPAHYHEARRNQIAELVRTRKPVKFQDVLGETVLDLTFYPVFDTTGNVVQFVSFALDITEQKRAEQALRESEERFKAIAETTPVGIGVVGIPDSKFIYVNKAYVRSFGYAEDELIGQGAPQIYWSPEERERALAILKEKSFVAEYEIKLKRKDGTLFWGFASVRPITFDGKPALLGAYVDITDRKNAEEKTLKTTDELRRTNADLERFNRAMVDRELRMIEMKKEINDLCLKFGLPVRYELGHVKEQ
jgi:PAS domain S-box-containing protein